MDYAELCNQLKWLAFWKKAGNEDMVKLTIKRLRRTGLYVRPRDYAPKVTSWALNRFECDC